jgi:hypothetical protein
MLSGRWSMKLWATCCGEGDDSGDLAFLGYPVVGNHDAHEPTEGEYRVRGIRGERVPVRLPSPDEVVDESRFLRLVERGSPFEAAP